MALKTRQLSIEFGFFAVDVSDQEVEGSIQSDITEKGSLDVQLYQISKHPRTTRTSTHRAKKNNFVNETLVAFLRVSNKNKSDECKHAVTVKINKLLLSAFFKSLMQGQFSNSVAHQIPTILD